MLADRRVLLEKAVGDLRESIRMAANVCETICYAYQDEIAGLETMNDRNRARHPFYAASDAYQKIMVVMDKIVMEHGAVLASQKVILDNLTSLSREVKSLNQAVTSRKQDLVLPPGAKITIDLQSLTEFAELSRSGSFDGIIRFCERWGIDRQSMMVLLRQSAMSQLSQLCYAFDAPCESCTKGSQALLFIKDQMLLTSFEQFAKTAGVIVEHVGEGTNQQ